MIFFLFSVFLIFSHLSVHPSVSLFIPPPFLLRPFLSIRHSQHRTRSSWWSSCWLHLPPCWPFAEVRRCSEPECLQPAATTQQANKQTNKQTSSGSHYLYIYLAHFFIHFSLFLLFVSLILTACVAFNSRLFDLDCFHLPDHFVPWVFSPATFQFLLFLVPVPSPNISGLFSFPLWLSCLPHFSYKQV